MTFQWPTTAPVVAARGSDVLPAPLRAEVEHLLSEGSYVAIVLEAPQVLPELLTSPELKLPPELQPCVFWHSAAPARAAEVGFETAALVETEPGDETAVGLGVFDEVTAPWGDTEVLRRFADDRLKRFRIVGPGSKALPLRVYAAVGFTPHVSQTPTADVWTDLNGAWGVLPRLTYFSRSRPERSSSREHRESWFCLTLGPTDLPHWDSMVGHVSSLARKLRGAHFLPGVAAESTRAPAETSETTWASWLEHALRAIDDQVLEKVVAARAAQFTFHTPLSPAHTLLSLGTKHSDSTRFAFFRGRSVFLGATPERLIAKHGRHFETEALAGTVRRRDASLGPASTSDFGPKEHKEHSPVIAQILNTLAPFCSTLSHDPNPQLRAQQQVLHLRTAVRGELNSHYHVLSLVQALHPTPAVGGCPTAQALHWIGEYEDFDRGLYAGPVGWVDADGDGQFNVALRSGVLRGDQATLFAGAGIVSGSDAQREFEETALKLQVLLDSLCYAPSPSAR